MHYAPKPKQKSIKEKPKPKIPGATTVATTGATSGTNATKQNGTNPTKQNGTNPTQKNLGATSGTNATLKNTGTNTLSPKTKKQRQLKTEEQKAARKERRKERTKSQTPEEKAAKAKAKAEAKEKAKAEKAETAEKAEKAELQKIVETTPVRNSISQTTSVAAVEVRPDDAAAEKARADKVAKKLETDQKTSQEIKAKKQKKLADRKTARNAINHKQVIADIDTKIDTIIADKNLNDVEKQKQIGELESTKSVSEEKLMYKNRQNISKNQIAINSLQKQIDESSDPSKQADLMAQKNAMETALEKKKAGLNNETKQIIEGNNIARQQKKNNKTRKAQAQEQQAQAQGQAPGQAQGQAQGQGQGQAQGQGSSAPVTKTAPQAALEQATAALGVNATKTSQGNNSQGKTKEHLLLEQNYKEKKTQLKADKKKYKERAINEQRKMDEYMKANPGKTYKTSAFARIFTRSIKRNLEKARIAGVNLERNKNKFTKDMIDLNKKTEENIEGQKLQQIVAARLVRKEEKSKRIKEEVEATRAKEIEIAKKREDAWKQFKKDHPNDPEVYPKFKISQGYTVINTSTQLPYKVRNHGID